MKMFTGSHTITCTSVLGGVALTVVLVPAHAAAGVQLPVPCFAGTCAPNKTPGFNYPGTGGTLTGPTGFVQSGQATATQSGNTLTINQASNQAILNWSSFNIGAGGQVVFQQPGSTSVALNKIYQASPSSIFGTLSANGQVFLINPNGFVFGATAKVNVAGLMASSLGLYGGDTDLANGITSEAASARPSLQSDTRVYVTDANGNQVLDSNGNPQLVQIQVQPGASITASDGGRILLAGQQVTNGGTLTAPDGQIVLAAGQAVYLQSSSDPSLRGLVVEVNNSAVDANNQPLPNPATPPLLGTVSNQSGGELSAPRGNVSLIGYAVNQSGRISATTAVSANGSVILQAAQGGAPVGACSNGQAICAIAGGTLTLAPSSDIEVLPEIADTTTTAAVAQPQIQSSVNLAGESVFIQGGEILAPGGSLKVLAAADPNAGLQVEGNTAAQIRVAAGTDIDLAGSNAQLPMSANLLTLQLRGNELEDDPDQRDGALHGATIIVDTRDGRPPIVSDASWQAALQGVQEDIAQRTSAGGSVSFKSEGDLVVSEGSSINVSGGQWNYAGGAIQTSQLIGANGQTYSVETANPSLSYSGVLNPTYIQNYNGFGVQLTGTTPGLYHIEPSYVQGFSAGTVTLTAPAMVVQGSLVGTATDGPYQRGASSIPAESLAAIAANNGTIPTSGAVALATGGQLVIGEPVATQNSAGLPYYFAPGVTFASNSNVTPTVVADGAPLPPQTLQLPVSYLTSGGFSSTEIFSDGAVTVPAGLPLNLGAGGSLLLVAPRVSIDSSIQALGGAINLEAAASADFSSTARTGIDIASGVTLDVRGQWTNDSMFAAPTALTTTWQNGGSIILSLSSDASVLPPSIAALLPKGTNSLSPLTSGGELTLGNDVNLLASGGAWLQSNDTVAGGKGGQIAIEASPYQSALEVGSNINLSAFGVQGAVGGSFTLEAPRLLIDDAGAWSGAQQIDYLHAVGSEFVLGGGLFSQYGFSDVNLVATAPALSANNADVLTVTTGTAIDASAESWQLSGYVARPSGGTVQAFAQSRVLPPANQTPFTISLEAVPAVTDPYSTALGVSNLGNVDIQAGSSIVAGPGGETGSSIALVGQGSILVDGTLSAPGGAISAHIEDPTAQFDPGLIPGQRIEVGATAVVDVSGTSVLTPNSQGLPLGSVLPGGSVDLIADRGAVIVDGPAAASGGTAAAPGAVIDIAGSSTNLDVLSGNSSGYTLTTVSSSGGSLLLSAGESISLLGTLRAQAGGGSATSAMLEGGSLELDLQSAVLPNFRAAAPAEIDLVANTVDLQPSTATADIAVLDVSELNGSGIGALRLTVGGPSADGVSGIIRFDTAAPLIMAREVVLDAPVLSVGPGVSATVNAPYVGITDSQQLSGAASASGGSGQLAINAQEITLAGYSAVQGAGIVSLNSSGDVQFEPQSGIQLAGGLNFAGNLNISADRLFPATLASYSIDDQAVDSAGARAGSVNIAQTGTSAGVPLSNGGSLSINAATINDNATILAPFGTISLQAANSLNLGASSVTSVSADGAVLPFGQTTLGQQEWIYAAGNDTLPVTGLPTPNGGQGRTVLLSAPDVNLAKGALVDVSGGGDLSAYEWVPGLGGSTDALGQTQAAKNGLYAVLPGTQGQYAAYDLQEFSGSNVSLGQSVYLSGIAGLAAGIYPLLPARDALLPGAYLIQAEPSYQSLTGGTLGALADGTPVVAGYFSFGNTGLRSATTYTGFAVWPGNYSQQLAQYDISYASSFFAPTTAVAQQTSPRLPADAGSLLIAVGQSLNVAGTVDATAAKGGTAATVDIYTTSPGDITVGPGNAPAGSGLVLNAATLQSWNAGNLILGGQLQADGSLNVTAGSVTFESGTTLNAGEVLAVANNSIDVQDGAVIGSDSGVSGTAPSAAPQVQSLTLQQGGAALLAVSDTALPVVARSGGGSGGTIDLEAGSRVRTLGAVALDAPGGISVSDQATIDAPGASWSLATSSIAFTGGGASKDALAIDPALLVQLQGAGSIRLASSGAIDLLAPVALGVNGASAPTLRSLTLEASAINNAGGNSVFGADAVMLTGVGNGPSVSAATADGTLSFAGNSLDFGGAGSLAINGDIHTTLTSAGSLMGHDSGQLYVNSGDLLISAAQLTAASQSSASVTVASGSLNIQQSGTAVAPSSLLTSLGGGLSLAAVSILDSGSIIVPDGRIGLQATAGDITVASAAQIDAGGLAVTAMNQTHGAPGGIVNIIAMGNLTLAPGSSINVSGAYDAPGGALALNAGGNISSGATLSGGAGSFATSATAGGNFNLNAGGHLAGGLSATFVNALGSGGFTNVIAIEVGSGDLDLAASGCATSTCTLNANQVTLSADSGSIDIAGAINAPSAALRGSIGLFAAGNVTLEGSGALHADGSGLTGRGGEVELSAEAGSLNLDAGSVITAQGDAQAGTLLLRASAQGNDVAIGNIGSDVSRVGTVIVEPVLPSYDYASIGDFTGNFGQIQADVQSYAAAAQAAVTARLDIWGTGPSLVFEPGVVVESHDPSGVIDLQQTLNLTQLLAMPIDLTVRSAGGVEINAGISDGENNNRLFSSGTTSSSLRFVAGANLNSANPLAVVDGQDADLVLGSGAILQTGTGDLDLVAARDVLFGSGAAAYTTGTAPQSGASTQKVKGGGNNITLTFATDGGNVLVAAGRDVDGSGAVGGIGDWLGRTTVSGGTGVTLGAWGVNLAAYDQNPWDVATFGGGDVSVTAGRGISQVSAAAADGESALAATATTSGTQTHFTSGGLTVTAGGDITTGQFYLADGTGTLTAGQAFATTAVSGASLGQTNAAPVNVGSLIGLEDAQVSLWATGDINLAAVANPTTLYQPTASGPATSIAFFTYGSNSALNVQSAAGTVTVDDSRSPLTALVGQTDLQGTADLDSGYSILPGSLSLRALTQGLDLGNFAGTMYPSATGNLQLFAGGSISGGALEMSDAPIGVLATGSNATAGSAGVVSIANVGTFSPLNFDAGIHVNDANSAQVTAGVNINDLILDLPKAAQIEAGNDISNLRYQGENLTASQQTLIYAGHDFIDPLQFGATGLAIVPASVVNVGGPGALDMLAGHDISLGFSGGVTTSGNLQNANLASGGASITMLAGLGQAADYADFFKNVVEPSAPYESELVSYVQSLTGQTGLSASQANTEFQSGFTINQQRAFIDQVFFSELNQSGLAAGTLGPSGYQRGYAAITTLFPGSPIGAAAGTSAYSGDLSLTYSEVYTKAGGDISLLVPDGSVNVGLASPPSASANDTKPAAELGIVAEGVGDLNIYALGDVNVNSSRVFTLGGGNILIWSQQGSIDAGNGAKTSLSLPPPTVAYDANGNPYLSFNAAVAGSGIRTIQTALTEPAGNVDLIAPIGTVDAGDAGIGAAGDINIAAASVVGAANINFGGTATGVPAVVSNVTASVSGAASSATGATNGASSLDQGAGKADQAAPLAAAALSWLDVFVTGMGDENCKPEDVDCLKRQAHH